MTSMDLTRLRHYGLSFAESEPRGAARRRLMLRAAGSLRRQLGALTTARLLLRSLRLRHAADPGGLAALREQGIQNRDFVAVRVEETALAAAVVAHLGMDRARSVYLRLLEDVADVVMHELVPSAADLNAFHDPFAAFRGYLEAAMDANARAGIHRTTMRENTADVFAYDVTYCAYERVAAAFGNPRLCHLSSCVADEISFPRLCGAFGVRFVRQSTLAAGAPCCDFRFERTSALPVTARDTGRSSSRPCP